MKLLTFFGIGNYQPTIYAWDGRQVQASYAPVASAAFLAPDEVIIFLTEDVRQHAHFGALCQALPQGITVRPVGIPLGRNESELWTIFNIVASQVNPGETVAFDITHGLRSFPLLGLLVAAYLRSGLDVRLEAVFYGAYDVGRENGDGITPFFDLTPMLQLLDWAEAADRLNRTGDSRYLASLLGQKKKEMAQQSGTGKARFEILSPVDRLMGTLTQLSNNTHLIRPVDAVADAARLASHLEEANPIFERFPNTAPFALLLNAIHHTYQPLAGDQPSDGENSFRESLLRQKSLIDWYVEREHWVQAVTVAREWLVSWVMYRFGLPDMVSSNDRHRIEQAINVESHALIDAKKESREYQPIFLRSLPNVKEVLDLWNKTAMVRNDIDHAGMRSDPKKPDSLIRDIREVALRIAGLSLE
ncbi:MAG: TIGR02221 family CRISPR-associated protein [Anaerolineae bacterium]|nr:TIGR02221 family CRISPR-associated protein [Anaerolineae bacterium]